MNYLWIFILFISYFANANANANDINRKCFEKAISLIETQQPRKVRVENNHLYYYDSKYFYSIAEAKYSLKNKTIEMIHFDLLDVTETQLALSYMMGVLAKAYPDSTNLRFHLDDQNGQEFYAVLFQALEELIPQKVDIFKQLRPYHFKNALPNLFSRMSLYERGLVHTFLFEEFSLLKTLRKFGYLKLIDLEVLPTENLGEYKVEFEVFRKRASYYSTYQKVKL